MEKITYKPTKMAVLAFANIFTANIEKRSLDRVPINR